MNPDLLFAIGFKLLIVAFLVLLNGFFVAAEFALVKIRDTQLDALVSRGHRRAKIARRVVSNIDSYISACQLGITLASLGLGWVGEPVFAAILSPIMDWAGIHAEGVRESISVVVGFSIITFLHITAGELAPKSLAIQKPMPTALWLAEPLEWFHRASFPFIWMLNRASWWILRRFGLVMEGEAAHSHSEDELRLLFTSPHGTSGRSSLGRAIVLNALDLRRRVARDVMRPRHEIVEFDTDFSIAECLDVAEKSRYSRFPLCEKGDLDHTLGVVHIKDLYAVRDTAKRGADLVGSVRKLIYVPETARLEKLLELFLERRLHMAIVVDEYGSTVGMATIENILEELVGQIQDEFDQEKPLLQKLTDRTWQLDGALPLHDLSDLVGETLEEEGISTTSGFVTHLLGGFPKVGDRIPLRGHELHVEELDGMRVSRLRLERAVVPEDPEAEE